MQSPHYQERVKKRVLNQSQPPLKVPEEPEEQGQTLDSMPVESSFGRWVFALLIVVITLVSFSLVEAYITLEALLKSHLILGIFLSALLGLLVLVLTALIFKEWQGVKQLTKLSQMPLSIDELINKDERADTLKTLTKISQTVFINSFAYRCHQAFQNAIKPHHTNHEILYIYQQKVQRPLLKEAKSVLKKESIGAGTIAFVSPNSLLQTLGILWISLRTLKKIAFIYGIRPSVIGNIRLFKIALENLATNSLTDFITDEMANQFGGSISDKLLANSADAITAASLNQRLGKALIKQLHH